MSQFANNLVLVQWCDPDGKAIVRDGRSQWLLVQQLIYDVGEEFSGESIRVPMGFLTDLASVPAPFRNHLPPDGSWAKAAVVHDFLYATAGTGIFHGFRYIDRLEPYTRHEADDILLEAMAALDVPAAQRREIYSGVRLGGAGGWGT